MIRQEDNGALRFILEQDDQIKARDQLTRRLGSISVREDQPKGNPREQALYSMVAAELFKEVFPEIGAAIENLGNEQQWAEKRPIFIEGFRFGHVRHNLKQDGSASKYLLDQKANPEKLNQVYTSEPEIVLALAMARILSPSNRLEFDGFSQNSSYGAPDKIHNHGMYALVAGQHSVEGVNTNIYYPSTNGEAGPDFQVKVKRGSFLIIPPGFDHSVDGFSLYGSAFGFEPRMKVTNNGERNTAVLFVPDVTLIPLVVSEAELQAAREKYILPPAKGKTK